jgi:hypothetical protein
LNASSGAFAEGGPDGAPLDLDASCFSSFGSYVCNCPSGWSLCGQGSAASPFTCIEGSLCDGNSSGGVGSSGGSGGSGSSSGSGVMSCCVGLSVGAECCQYGQASCVDAGQTWVNTGTGCSPGSTNGGVTAPSCVGTIVVCQ